MCKCGNKLDPIGDAPTVVIEVVEEEIFVEELIDDYEE